MAPGRQPDFDLCDEYYGLAWDMQINHFCTHLFDPHTHVWWGAQKPNYIEEVNETEKPVYTQGKIGFKNELPYPIDLIPEDLNYYESTFAYMLALAISKYPQEIHIWGVRMAADEEYAYQRANCEYMIGYARGLGIKVTIYNSTVCQYSKHFDKYPERYGLVDIDQ